MCTPFLKDPEEDVPGDKATIVIHPGSTHLHIGLSTDPTPHSIPHLIAYRRKGVAEEQRGVAKEEEGGASVHGKKWKEEDYTDESLVLKHCNDITVGRA